MKFTYHDSGSVARLVIVSTIFETSKHNRIVDAALLSADVVAHHSGWFLKTAVLTGKTPAVMRAYKAARKESSK